LNEFEEGERGDDNSLSHIFCCYQHLQVPHLQINFAEELAAI
jgi:hypothetical protein